MTSGVPNLNARCRPVMRGLPVRCMVWCFLQRCFETGAELPGRFSIPQNAYSFSRQRSRHPKRDRYPSEGATRQ